MRKVFATLMSIFLVFSANAQNFNAYLAHFKTEELPFTINRATLNGCRLNQGQMKAVSKADLYQFVLVQPSDKTLSPLFVNLPESKDLTKEKDIRFYHYKKLKLSPKFQSVIVYFVDEKDKNGLMNWKFILLNYSLEGKLMNYFELAYEEIFMSYRLHLAQISKDLKVKVEEIDFESRKNSKTPSYTMDFYYKIDPKSGEFVSVQSEKYPYEGLFEYKDEVLSITQNKDVFMVMRGKGSDKSTKSVNLTKFDLNKGTFIFVDDKNIQWQGVFDTDKNRITLSNQHKSVLVFKRK